jgi:predicted nucleic acid-binding Zn ribbon protein
VSQFAGRAGGGGDTDPRGAVATRRTRGVSWQNMSSRPARAIRDLLLQAMPQLGDRLVEQRLRASWSSVVGPEIARRSQPHGLVDGCLGIVVDNSPWLHELTLRQAELTARIRAAVPAVRSVRIRLGSPAADPAPAEDRPPRAVSLTTSDLRDIDDAASAIGDATLAAAARRLMTRARQFPPVRGAAQ